MRVKNNKNIFKQVETKKKLCVTPFAAQIKHNTIHERRALYSQHGKNLKSRRLNYK
jgi:hypothetical protein